MAEEEVSPRVRKFFERLGMEKIPRINFVEGEKIWEICGERSALGCVGKDGRIYVKKDLSFLLKESTEVHEIAHRSLGLKEVGAYTLEYWFLRKDPLRRRVKDKIFLSRLLGPLEGYYLDKGTVKPWEALYVDHLMRRKLPREVFEGRNEEGFVKLLAKVARLNYGSAISDIYIALRMMRYHYFNKPGEFAAFVLRGISRLQEEEKERVLQMFHRILDHLEGVYGESFDATDTFHVRDAQLAAELRAILYVLGKERKRESEFGKVSEFYRDELLPRIMGRLVEESLHNHILPNFFGMRNRPPAEG